MKAGIPQISPFCVPVWVLLPLTLDLEVAPFCLLSTLAPELVAAENSVKTVACLDVVEQAVVEADGIESNFEYAAGGSETTAGWACAAELVPSSAVCIASDSRADSASSVKQAIQEHLAFPRSPTCFPWDGTHFGVKQSVQELSSAVHPCSCYLIRIRF